MFSSLTCELFRNTLFSFQIFGDFQKIFFLSWISHSVVVRKHTSYDFGIFKFIEICYGAQYRSILGECFIIFYFYFCSFWIVFYIGFVDSVIHFSCILLIFFSLVVLSVIKRAVLKSPDIVDCVSFNLFSLGFMHWGPCCQIHIICTNNRYVFLVN